MSGSCDASVDVGSEERTTRSACLPGVTLPLMSSWWVPQAASSPGIRPQRISAAASTSRRSH
jgi:hypothetical protein